MADNFKFYAVRVGRVPGIYTSDKASKAQTDYFPCSRHMGFNTLAEAKRFIDCDESCMPEYYKRYAQLVSFERSHFVKKN